MEKGRDKLTEGGDAFETAGLGESSAWNLAHDIAVSFATSLPSVFKVTWVDFISGFAIAVISFGRLFSHTSEEFLITDWIVTIAAVLTFINPLLYSYYGITLATLNNLLIGGVVCLSALFLDWKDSHGRT